MFEFLTSTSGLALLAAAIGVIAAFFSIFAYSRSARNAIRSEQYVIRRIENIEPRASADVEAEPITRHLLIEIRELSRRLDRMESFSERLYYTSDEMASRTSSIINDAVAHLSSVADKIANDIREAKVQGPQRPAKTGTDTTSALQFDIPKELAHALKTPLARISILSDLLSPEMVNDQDKSRHIAAIKSAVQVCQYYLDAFRSLRSTKSLNRGDREEFRAALAKAVSTYIASSTRKIVVDMSAPEYISTLPVYYVIAALLPLVENAVEASQDGDVIKIGVVEAAGLIEARIENRFYGAPPLRDILIDGHTTKEQLGNEGLGLGIVQNFLSGLPTGHLKFNTTRRSTIVFRVTMGGQADG